jgi:mono/diheme cytochrome c family protein
MRVRPTGSAAVLAIVFGCLGLGIALAQGPAPDSGIAKEPAPQKAAAAPESTAADPAKGKMVYEKNCANCHKSDGTGGVKTVPTANASRNFRDPVFWKGKTDAQLRAAIENGFPKSGMLSYKGLLTPQEIRNVVAYVRARYQPKGVK